MKHIILIIGPSGSGKSYLQKKLIENGFKGIVSVTTRDKRDGEIDGIDYIFTKKNKFFENEFIEWDEIGENYYGTPVSEFYKSNQIAHVIEPFGAKKIIDKIKDKNIKIKTIFLNISKEQCLKNLTKDGEISEKNLKRINRDLKDSIPDRIKKVKLRIDLEINDLNYDVNEIILEIL